jgi:hypothetical protein
MESSARHPSPAADAAGIAMTDEAVTDLLRRHLTGTDSMHLCPNIPGKLEIAARKVHARHLPANERVLALFDDSVLGSGDEGFVVTSQRICWKNAGTTRRPQMIEWRHLDPDAMYADRNKLVLGVDAIELTGDPREDQDATLDAFEAVFHVLAFSARCAHPHADHVATRISERPTYRPSNPPVPLESEVVPRSDRRPPIANAKETAPPPHAVTYASYVVHASSQKAPKFECWHCHTPLHWNTPQCAHCSAWPSPQGWRRSA